MEFKDKKTEELREDLDYSNKFNSEEVKKKNSDDITEENEDDRGLGFTLVWISVLMFVVLTVLWFFFFY